MQTLPLSEFRAKTSATLDLVEQGATVRIMRHGKPVADLVPVRPQEAARQPSWKRKIIPLEYTSADGQTLAQRVLEARENARY